MTRPLLLLLLSTVLLGCSADPEPDAAGLTAEQACEQARAATADYNAGIEAASSADEARQAIVGTSEQLRRIDAPAPVDAAVAAVADSLTGALEAVDAQDQAAFQAQVARIQSTTEALAQTCGTPE